jgi:acetoacetate decarboxylase
MGFVKSHEELAGSLSMESINCYEAATLWVVWETSSATVERLLPPPLKPAKMPLAGAFVAHYPRTNFGPPYQEAGLALRAEFNGEKGFYFLAMPVTDDMAMVYGREVLGYPKKIAEIAFSRREHKVGGWVERHGIRYFSVHTKLTGTVSTADGRSVLDEMFNVTGDSFVAINYNFKYFHAPRWNGFDYAPRLIRGEVEYRPSAVELGEATVTLQPSDLDPWSEVEVVRTLGALYMKGTIVMRKGKVVAEVDPASFAPYSQLKVDHQSPLLAAR